jgi:predicted RNA binding protein YcfA (HicA-like mRNA interferase family)
MKELGDVNWKQFERFLLREGCQFKGKEGSHCKYKKPGLARPIIVPCYKKLPDFIILNNLRTLGVTRDSFVKKMKET